MGKPLKSLRFIPVVWLLARETAWAERYVNGRPSGDIQRDKILETLNQMKEFPFWKTVFAAAVGMLLC
jgi:hypothetical protein